ncbi:MAG: hypothetical protein QG632_10 [Candidatus Dependentiae bacterium]|nr:hypothetical protein [Candidatus Dependentiae bacterium]
MKRFLLILTLFGIDGFVFASKEPDSVAANAMDAETVQLRTFAKYAAVFRLLPARVSQMLQVVNAYPVNNVARRLDLLQIAIQRLHDKYRTMQQLHDRVLELQGQSDSSRRAGVHARCSVLLVSIKKYQITLVSILSVLDAEFVRFAKTVHDQKNEGSTTRDAAFMAAKSSLSPTKMDVLISMLVSGSSSPSEEVAGSVVQEIRQLRDEVSQLSAQLQSKALIEGGNVKNDKVFNQNIQILTEESARVSAEAKADFAFVIDENITPAPEPKAASLKTRRVSAKTLQGRAIAFHDRMINAVYSSYGWVKAKMVETGETIGAGWDRVMALPILCDIHDFASSVVGRVFNDTHKAAKHVEHRMKEVKDATPGGVSLIKETACGFMDWIVESWIRVGQYMLSLLDSVGDYWHVVHEKAQEFDEGMRDVACQVCDWFVQGWHGLVSATLAMKLRIFGEIVTPVVGVGSSHDIEKDIQTAPQSITDRLISGVGQAVEAGRVAAKSALVAVTSWKERIWSTAHGAENEEHLHERDMYLHKGIEEEKIVLPSWTEQLYEAKAVASARLHECVVQAKVIVGRVRDKMYALIGKAPAAEKAVETK